MDNRILCSTKKMNYQAVENLKCINISEFNLKDYVLYVSNYYNIPREAKLYRQ